VRCEKMSCTLLIAVAIWIPATTNAQWKTPWSYEGARGPEHWGELDPDYAICNVGKNQSPIDVQNTEKADLPPLRFEFKSAPLNYLVNNGKTIRVNYHDAPGAGNFLQVGDQRYQLMQFHFHRPSEEYIRGKRFDMVVHLMLKAANGKAAGVAVLMQAGKANATVRKLWAHMPKIESKVLPDLSHQEQEVAGIEVDPAGLLPRDLAYYEYAGSVTAPPCTEGVTWYVLKASIDISPEQIAAFARLYPQDVRPLQPLNGRVVKESR
jgi:carbonic anhydrase